MQTVFEAIKDRLPITEVLATYITLISSGSQLKAKCPFHTERSASFSVSPERGLYYCFGCGAKGDIFTFVEQFEGVDRKGALKILADRAGIVLTRDQTPRESTDPLYDILEATTTRYQQELARHPEVIKYLHSRGITEKTIEAFRIGYVPDEWRYVANTTMNEAIAAVAERAGLIKKTPKGYYDRFRDRVIFPFMDTSGRVVGFSGRLYSIAPDMQSPKYLNSPETELFQKSKILFGFDKAKTAIRTHNFAILVEGQIDCVLAHQAGFKNTVATSGTAVSDTGAFDPSSNLAVLARLTPNIFLAFDGDTAGQKALNRAAVVALKLGMNPKVVPLPDGTDPADYIKANGTEAWKALLKESQHFIVHQLQSIHHHDVSAHALVQMIKDQLFPFLVHVQSPIEQGRYIEIIAKDLDIAQHDVASELTLYAAQHARPESADQPIAAFPDVHVQSNEISLEERCIVLATRYPTAKNAEYIAALTQLRFEEHLFVAQAIDEHRLHELLPLIEREYGHLSDLERDMIVGELAKKLENSFFARVRSVYTRALDEAEHAHDEGRARALMSALQVLTQRRHGD